MAVASEWLSGIYEISKVINTTLELGEILQVVARETRRLIQFDRLVLGLLHEDGSHLRLFVPVAAAATSRPTGTLIPLEGHVLGETVRGRATLVVADLRADSRFPGDRPLVEEGIVSCISLPLVSGDRTLGALAFARSAAQPFAPTEAEMLHSVAEQVAVALDRAKLFAAERKRANHLAMINQVASRALGILDLETLLQQTASLVQKQFAYYDVGIFLVDRAAQEVVLRAQAGAYTADSAIGYRQAIGVGLVGQAAKTGQTILANDVAHDPRYILAFEGEKASKAELAVPIILHGQVAGVINIECTEVGAFDQADVLAVQTLSDLLAQAIENAALYDEMRYLRDLDEAILAAIPSSILVVDRSRTVLMANEMCSRVLERPVEQLIGQKLESLLAFHPTVSGPFYRGIERVVDAEERLAFPAMRLRLPNGQERVADVHLSPVARLGQCRAIVFVHDITERCLAEEALQREKQKLDDIVSAMGAGVALIGPDMRILLSNPTMDAWFGGGSSVVGQKCHIVHAQHADSAPECPAAATFASGEVHTDLQVRHNTPLGTRHFENIFAPIRDPAGNVVQIILLAFDVTEHARNVEQLALLQRLSQVMQGVIERDRLLHLILTCVTAGPGLGFNRAVLLLTNDDRSFLEGRLGVGPATAEEASAVWRDLAERAPTLEALLALFDQPQPAADSALRYLAQQIRIPLSDQSQAPVRALLQQRPIVVTRGGSDPGVGPELRSVFWAPQLVCVPLIAHDDALGVIVADNAFTGHAIGEREVEVLQTFANQAALAISAATAYRRLEEKINELEETRDRLVRAENLAVVGRLAAHVAHEIRNPLATIGGFSRAILRRPQDTARVERNTRIILEEVERLEQILANVMNFTRPSAPVLRERSINDSVEALCAFHEHALAERNIVLHKSLDPNLPTLRFDPDQIRQVLINLVQNAVESMPEGGELTILTRAVQGHVEIVVADTGQGMAESVQESVFQPFFTTKAGGTGLGLSVCQKIIQDHGGDILVRSKPGAGSSFTISLPIPREPAH